MPTISLYATMIARFFFMQHRKGVQNASQDSRAAASPAALNTDVQSTKTACVSVYLCSELFSHQSFGDPAVRTCHQPTSEDIIHFIREDFDMSICSLKHTS